MKRILLSLAALLLLATGAFSQGTTRVKGHTRKDGTHVAPHERTKANSTKKDNWSTKGNTNPRTGKRGTKNP